MILMAQPFPHLAEEPQNTGDAAENPGVTPGKVLFVLTSHKKLGETGKETGFYLSEAAHPYFVLKKAGHTIDFVSPEGGEAPIDPKSMDLDDPINKQVWEDPNFQQGIKNTKKPGDIDPQAYDAIFFAGGHGTMWDFPDNPGLQKLTRKIYEGNGVVAAVCHGPAALVNVELSDGSKLLENKNVAGFTNDEEKAVDLQDTVPFLLETKLEEAGAKHTGAENFEKHVVVDGRLVTGQNPASATELGEKIRELLGRKKTGVEKQ